MLNGGLKQKTDMIPASGAQCDHKTKPHTAAQLTVIIGGLEVEVMVMGRGTGCGDWWLHRPLARAEQLHAGENGSSVSGNT